MELVLGDTTGSLLIGHLDTGSLKALKVAAPHVDTGAIVARDPVRLEATLAVDGDRRRFTIDGDASVIGIE